MNRWYSETGMVISQDREGQQREGQPAYAWVLRETLRAVSQWVIIGHTELNNAHRDLGHP